MKRKSISALLVLCLLLQCMALTAGAQTSPQVKTESAEITYPVAIDETNFPDAIFCSYVSTILDMDRDNVLSKEEAESVTQIEVSGRGISDMTGLAYFSHLETLDCSWNSLPSLDVSNNTELTSLSCEGNQLTSLDVRSNTKLTKLVCYYNQLTTLDVSNNTELTSLSCEGNQLTSLDVRSNTKLTKLVCYYNQLTTLDVSQNTALTYLDCSFNKLTSLDVSHNTELTRFYCYENQLTSLDVSQNAVLTLLDCGANQLTSLDVRSNTELTELRCGQNQLTTLDVSQNTALETLSLYGNQLTTLDVSHNTALTTLYCDHNQLTTLDVSQNAVLTLLDCGANQLTSLDVSHNTELTTLYCSYNKLTSLDITQNTKLTTLDCSNNNIGNLELADNSTLGSSSVTTQTRKVSALRHTGEDGTVYWTIDLGALVGAENLSRVTLSDDTVSTYGASYDATTGVATFTTAFPASVQYLYDTRQPNDEALMDVTLTVEETTAETPNTLKIQSAKLKLDEDVDLLYTVKVDEGYTDPYMVFTYHDTDYTVTDYTTLTDGRLCFTFSGVTPQCLGDNVSATLYAQASDGTTHTKTVANYSVRQYCINTLNRYPDNELLVTLLSDLLVYGEKSQLYMNYETDALVTDGVAIQPSTFTALDESVSKKAVSGEPSDLVNWTGVGLRYENNTTMYFLFTAQQTEGLTVEITIGGRTTSYDVSALTADNGSYRVDFNGILATEFDEPVTAVFKLNGEQIGQTATYSVNSYIYSNQDSTDSALRELVQATYNYGASARCYREG